MSRICCWVLGLAVCVVTARAEEPEKLFGALQAKLEHAKQGYEAGWRVAVIPVSWDRFEPEPGKFNEAYVAELRTEAEAFRKLGYRLQLDFGIQYPPTWLFALPDASYINQYGQTYRTDEPGKRMANFVFNNKLRAKLSAYIQAVFRELGTDWDWVRLGGGLYGEVNFPTHRFGGMTNAYWVYDRIAQGQEAGLPEGISVSPVPGWKPGEQSDDHTSARKFVEWMLAALQNYHDWQIAEVRRSFAGEICMLYGSWGIRPGFLEAAIQTDLNGSSRGEVNGEISAGYDWARMVGGIRDPKVIVYCTWLDAPADICDDKGKDSMNWSPVHWLVTLAEKNPIHLRVWGENTGGNTKQALDLTFERIRKYRLLGVLWAFEDQLYANPNPNHYATFGEFREAIQKDSLIP